jgi:CheY-like chemotaxis protein
MVIIANCGRPPEILLIDDNLGDAKLIKIAFRHTLPRANITVATSAEHGMSFLRAEHASVPHPPPDIVFLDLNLPSMHGHTFLKLMKNDPVLATIPVIIVSSSSAERDVTESYRLHASGFITKPFNLEDYEAFADQFASYWFKLVQMQRTVPLAS